MAVKFHATAAPIPMRKQQRQARKLLDVRQQAMARKPEKIRRVSAQSVLPGDPLNRADFSYMPDRAFAFLQRMDASAAFRTVLSDLAAK